MRELLARLGDPSASLDRSTSSARRASRPRRADRRARSAGRAYTSPHVSGWHERLQTDPAGFERAIERVRPAAEQSARRSSRCSPPPRSPSSPRRGVEVAVVEAGLGGRLDATNVLDARVVLLTNVGLEHTEVLGETREAIAREKLAVVRAGRDRRTPRRRVRAPRARQRGALRRRARGRRGVPRPGRRAADASLPGRLELRGGEVWDGAHTPEAADWLIERLPEPARLHRRRSILRDKDADAILERLAHAGSTLVATRELERPRTHGRRARRARGAHFQHVESVREPHAARLRALELAGQDGRILVTGSLYLLADLYEAESNL